MAKIGLKGLTYAELDTEAGTYGTPVSLGKGIKASVKAKSADASLYADDALAESDSSFVNADVSLEVDDTRDATVVAPLLGHAVGSGADAGVVTRNSGDVAPYVGVGRIVTLVVGNVKSYKAEFLSKVKFSEPDQDEQTKADNVTFGTTTLSGVASADASGNWSKAGTFATVELAQAFLDDCFGVGA